MLFYSFYTSGRCWGKVTWTDNFYTLPLHRLCLFCAYHICKSGRGMEQYNPNATISWPSGHLFNAAAFIIPILNCPVFILPHFNKHLLPMNENLIHIMSTPQCVIICSFQRALYWAGQIWRDLYPARKHILSVGMFQKKRGRVLIIGQKSIVFFS